uniref:ras association domain-containing protein 1-like n=1 Tax=Myxine glutinosa TaxID=7769 RepID=UPI00358DE98D
MDTGFIRVELNLIRATSSIPAKGACALSRRVPCTHTCRPPPPGTVKQLHVTNRTSARDVVRALLARFSTQKRRWSHYALYARSKSPAQASLYRLADTDEPLSFCFRAGVDSSSLSFVVQENEYGDVLWEAFSLPELSNFLRILAREEQEQLEKLKERYEDYRKQLKLALHKILLA